MTAKCEFDLTGERIFLTGAGRGMGEGMARTFATWGATVGAADIDEAGARETAETITAAAEVSSCSLYAAGPVPESSERLAWEDGGGIRAASSCLQPSRAPLPSGRGARTGSRPDAVAMSRGPPPANHGIAQFSQRERQSEETETSIETE